MPDPNFVRCTAVVFGPYGIRADGRCRRKAISGEELCKKHLIQKAALDFIFGLYREDLKELAKC